MTRKDYILIAGALLAAKPQDANLGQKLQHQRCVHRIAEALQKDNVRFDYSRFVKAAGVDA